ncbi:hypothetical protein [Corallococcus exercitus]|uniref:Uncharacterized protein n=1 Tax=Corallococcus exercitus TaxID=2316736 RepID=A0A7Y4KMK9_9BACT|nr:hypothetical protein [Corallococcus exercitus]NOK36587.1 hypothetical protein [Corallococcus exercitus]
MNIMSVSLISGAEPGGGPVVEVPVATNIIFNQYWRPAAEELGLELIRKFPGGLSVTPEIMPDLVVELGVIERRFLELNEPWLAGRASTLRQWLVGAIERGVDDVYVG